MADNKASKNGTPKNPSVKEEVLDSAVSAESEQPVEVLTDTFGEPSAPVEAVVVETPVAPPEPEPVPVVVQAVTPEPVQTEVEPYPIVLLKRHLEHYAEGMHINRVANPDQGAIHQKDLVEALENWVKLHAGDPKVFFKYTGILLKWFQEHANGVAHESYINRWLGGVYGNASSVLKHTDFVSVIKRLASPETRAVIASNPDHLHQSLKNVKPPEAFIALLVEGLQNPGLLK